MAEAISRLTYAAQSLHVNTTCKSIDKMLNISLWRKKTPPAAFYWNNFLNDVERGIKFGRYYKGFFKQSQRNLF